MQKQIESNPQEKGIILSGIRPTGELHLGHFEAVLKNWVKLQEDYKCFYFIADWHAITTDTDTKGLKKSTLSIVKDWLAFGIDPEKSTVFIQSQVPEHSECSLALERLVNIGTLRRLPTFKGYLEHLAGERKIYEKGELLEGEQRLETVANAELSVGFLTYPVLQAADILLYDATHVPVGEDQLPHIELTREIARKFNKLYGDIFVIPEALLDSNIVLLRGYDRRKMSKSYGNDISPGDNEEELTKKVRMFVTNRKRLEDKGDPFECAVYDLHRAFNTKELEINKACLEASIKCQDCKMILPKLIAESYAEYQEKKEKISDDFVKDVLNEGKLKAGKVAKEKMNQIKYYMLMDYI